MYTTVYKGIEMALSLGFRARSSSTSPLSPHIFMASSLGSLSSLLPHPLPPTPRPNPRFLYQPHRTASFRSCLQAQRETEIARESSPPPPPPPPLPPPPPPSEKRSFAVAAGELLLGLASRLVRRGKDSPTLSAEDFAGEDVEKVVEDPIDRGVIWEQRSEDVEAEKERKAVTSPGFSFSAAGLLFPYHLGVAKLLLEKGYIKETTPLAGSSAGAIVCAVIASGSSMQDALEVTKVLAEDCRLKGTAFRLGAVLREVLNEIFPDDVHLRCNGRVRIAVTQLLWRPKGLLVDKFDSKEDLINAVFTSSFIPGYLAPRPATMFRNRLCIDGGLTLFMPPTSASATVRICAFPAFQLGLKGIGISPDCNPENRAGPRQLLNWALEPAEDDVLDKLYELGYLDAAVWAEQNPVESIVKDDSNPNIS